MAKFLRSIGVFKDFPPPAGAEFALLGRSNVGKSSFINHQFRDRSLARAAKTPGTTGNANLYDVGDDIYWVDLPGYGFARMGRGEKERWSRLIRDYCERRENLAGVIWIVDMRHIGLDRDMEAALWLAKLGHPVLPLLAKADKLSGNERRAALAAYRRKFSGFGEPVVYSIHESASRERFLSRYEEWRESTG